ncbi:hypothetical protein Sango_2256800 [Sesamum angolense]|uniref:TPM domain-containing protein n=1 Tax=Sesamum angolense TaxID=2727404 RepID=A0AAE1W9F2_9LAMI|nr:hypothetical protein Sango_2256800 [Sesamum angolense]
METILSPHSLCPLFKNPLLPSFQPKSSYGLKPACCTFRKQPSLSVVKQSFDKPTSWLSNVHQGLAALAISLALNFSLPILTDSALASEFDVLNEGPPKESYVVDDAGVLSRSKADAFEYADQVLERWYPTVEEGNKKGIVVLITSQKEGAVTGGPEFIQAVGDSVLDGTVSENLPVLATEEKYNEAVFSSAKRLVAAIDGLPDPGGPQAKDNKRESNFKTREETDEKRGQFTLVVGGLLVIAFVVPMAQYYAYVSKK